MPNNLVIKIQLTDDCQITLMESLGKMSLTFNQLFGQLPWHRSLIDHINSIGFNQQFSSSTINWLVVIKKKNEKKGKYKGMNYKLISLSFFKGFERLTTTS